MTAGVRFEDEDEEEDEDDSLGLPPAFCLLTPDFCLLTSDFCPYATNPDFSSSSDTSAMPRRERVSFFWRPVFGSHPRRL